MEGLRLPPRVRAILEDADEQLDWDDRDNQTKLYIGVLLNQGTRKFWLDENNKHGFIIYARGLSIFWVEDPRFWRWTSCDSFAAAKLIRVSRLHISGKIKPSHLSLGVQYEIVFEVLIKNGATGWQLPVNLELNVSNKSIQKHQKSLETLPREQWIDIKVGTFMVTEADICAGGEVEFSMFEHRPHNKTGLLVKCAIIRPNKLCYES